MWARAWRQQACQRHSTVWRHGARAATSAAKKPALRGAPMATHFDAAAVERGWAEHWQVRIAHTHTHTHTNKRATQTNKRATQTNKRATREVDAQRSMPQQGAAERAHGGGGGRRRGVWRAAAAAQRDGRTARRPRADRRAARRAGAAAPHARRARALRAGPRPRRHCDAGGGGAAAGRHGPADALCAGPRGV